jgi:uncharacterized protein (DUF4415 family)
MASKPLRSEADADNPELSAEDFARARPFSEVFPRQYRAWKRVGRPPVEVPTVHIGFRLAADVVAGIRASGRGYNSRVEKVLREALAKGLLSPGSSQSKSLPRAARTRSGSTAMWP